MNFFFIYYKMLKHAWSDKYKCQDIHEGNKSNHNDKIIVNEMTLSIINPKEINVSLQEHSNLDNQNNNLNVLFSSFFFLLSIVFELQLHCIEFHSWIYYFHTYNCLEF